MGYVSFQRHLLSSTVRFFVSGVKRPLFYNATSGIVPIVKVIFLRFRVSTPKLERGLGKMEAVDDTSTRTIHVPTLPTLVIP